MWLKFGASWRVQSFESPCETLAEVCGVDFLHLFLCDGHVGKNCALRSQMLLLHSCSSRSYSLYRKVISNLDVWFRILYFVLMRFPLNWVLEEMG